MSALSDMFFKLFSVSYSGLLFFGQPGRTAAYLVYPMSDIAERTPYSNFVKFGSWEIGEIVRYLLDQKTFACLSKCHYCTDHAQSLPGPAE